MNAVQIWVILAAVFILYATFEVLCRLIKKEPFWPVLRRWLTNIFDTLTGGF